MHDRFKHFRHGRESHGRPGAKGLGDKTTRRCGDRLLQQVAYVLVDVAHPIARKQELVVLCNRSGEPYNRIYPGGVSGFYQEFRVGAVLAAAIGDAAVDYDNLAMIAQVYATGEGTQ